MVCQKSIFNDFLNYFFASCEPLQSFVMAKAWQNDVAHFIDLGSVKCDPNSIFNTCWIEKRHCNRLYSKKQNKIKQKQKTKTKQNKTNKKGNSLSMFYTPASSAS